MIDHEGRLFGKINLLDLVVVLIVLALAVRLALSWLGAGPANVAATPTTVTFTAVVEGVRTPTSSAIKVGQTVYETRTNGYLGKVTAVRVVPADVLVEKKDGTRVETKSQTRRDVFVTIKGPGRATPTSVTVGSQQIHIGTALQFETSIWGVTGTVWDIDLGGASPSS